MNKKLILLGIIVLIIILLGCIFITNEGFVSNQNDQDNKCSKSKCSKIIDNEKCKEDTECKWKNNKCLDNTCIQSECSLIHNNAKCNEDTECKWDTADKMCKKSKQGNKDSNCNKITIKKSDKSIEEKSINTVCPTDPKCVATCIDDHTWINDETQSNIFTNKLENYDGDMNNSTLKSPDDAHLITSSRCMECIKNFFPVVSLIKNHSCDSL
tara:strand:+ start:2460 stop:3095 length:636 start_codon:yes stop_codon:yes gene_type:complete